MNKIIIAKQTNNNIDEKLVNSENKCKKLIIVKNGGKITGQQAPPFLVASLCITGIDWIRPSEKNKFSTSTTSETLS